jgi:bacteriocin biosynthesis cyclodehydratase domain-containing protein
VDDSGDVASVEHSGAMAPILDPALLQLWRDGHTLQLGLAPDAPVLGGLDAATTGLLRDNRPQSEAAAELRAALARVGVPTHYGARIGRGPLAPELAAATVLTGSRHAAQERIQRRGTAYVRIEGVGRVGATVGTLLAAAGIGRVQGEDAGTVDSADMTPAGARPRDSGLRRDVAWEAAITRYLDRALTEPDPNQRPDLVILTPVHGLGRQAAQGLVRDNVPHIVARLDGVTAVVGPLVLPGRSCCVNCTDLHRTARDPAWPRLVAQAERHPVADPPYDLALASLAAAQVAIQALTFIAGEHPVIVGGTLETSLRDGITRRRSWARHPACGCRWADSA